MSTSAKSKGFMTVISGCMFAGKTDELIRLLTREQIAKRPYKLFKPVIDTRYSKTKVVSHSGKKLNAVVIYKPQAILTWIKTAESTSEQPVVIGIDEIQFFSAEIVDVCTYLIDQGYDIICAGLRQDYMGKPFGQMPLLLAMADNLVSLTAICTECGNEATMTQRIHKTSGQIALGGSELYEARCKKHFTIPS